MKTSSLVLVSVVSASVLACSGDGDGGRDAGFPDVDAGEGGAGRDAGVETSEDSGSDEDASTGASEDAGSDAGTGTGTGEDAGADGDADAGTGEDAGEDAGALDDAGAPADAGGGSAGCSGDSGLSVPSGFCVDVFADQLSKPRHITVSPAGDVYVAVEQRAVGAELRGPARRRWRRSCRAARDRRG